MNNKQVHIIVISSPMWYFVPIFIIIFLFQEEAEAMPDSRPSRIGS